MSSKQGEMDNTRLILEYTIVWMKYTNTKGKRVICQISKGILYFPCTDVREIVPCTIHLPTRTAEGKFPVIDIVPLYATKLRQHQFRNDLPHNSAILQSIQVTCNQLDSTD